MDKIILELNHVSYRYSDANKDDYVLKDISFSFELGKTYAIKGKSGSGKTTLLSLISGLETDYEGEILFDDKELRKINLDLYRSNNIGVVFQSYNLLPHMSAVENIMLSMDISKVEVKDKRKKAIELMESVGLSKKQADRRVLKLSGGEQQRVAIARSLSYDPKIIIADEPTGNLDRETEDEILKIFKRLAAEQNRCIIIVTHSKDVSDNVDTVYELKGKNKKND